MRIPSRARTLGQKQIVSRYHRILFGGIGRRIRTVDGKKISQKVITRGLLREPNVSITRIRDKNNLAKIRGLTPDMRGLPRIDAIVSTVGKPSVKRGRVEFREGNVIRRQVEFNRSELVSDPRRALRNAKQFGKIFIVGAGPHFMAGDMDLPSLIERVEDLTSRYENWQDWLNIWAFEFRSQKEAFKEIAKLTTSRKRSRSRRSGLRN